MRVSLPNTVYSQFEAKSLNKKQEKSDSSPVYQYNLKADKVSFGNNLVKGIELSAQDIETMTNLAKLESTGIAQKLGKFDEIVTEFVWSA
jgi:hypothetical protein